MEEKTEGRSDSNITTRLKWIGGELFRSRRRENSDTEVKLVSSRRTSSLKAPQFKTSLSKNGRNSAVRKTLIREYRRRNSTNTVVLLQQDDESGSSNTNTLSRKLGSLPSVIVKEPRSSSLLVTDTGSLGRINPLFNCDSSTDLVSPSSKGSNLSNPNSLQLTTRTNKPAEVEGDGAFGQGSGRSYFGAGSFRSARSRILRGLGPLELVCSCWRSAANCLKVSLQGKYSLL